MYVVNSLEASPATTMAELSKLISPEILVEIEADAMLDESNQV